MKKAPSSQSRLVRVFISSTFRDFMGERDELVKKIFPELRSRCKERFVEVLEVDLRWGITEEQSKQGETLRICLREIDRCRPSAPVFFIGMLGERYGWIPPQDFYPKDVLDDPDLEWVKDHVGGKSVTELEILHGVLRDAKMRDKAFFYFRNDGYEQRHWDEIHTSPAYSNLAPPVTQDDFTNADSRAGKADAAKLNELKQRVRDASFKWEPKDYETPEKLASMVLEDLWSAIDEIFPASSVPDALARESLEHRVFMENRSKAYVERVGLFEKLDAFVDTAKIDALDSGDEDIEDDATKTAPPLPAVRVVLGESGSGKSALLAAWLEPRMKGVVFFHFTGATPASGSGSSILRRLLATLRQRGAVAASEAIPQSDEALAQALPMWLERLSEQGGGILLIDAVNQLGSARDRELWWWPEQWPANVCIIISTLAGDSLREMQRRGWITEDLVIRVQPLQTGEKHAIMDSYLKLFTRELEPRLQEQILAAPQTANPLFLRTVVEELRLRAQHTTLESNLAAMLSCPDPAALFVHVLKNLERDFTPREHPGLVRRALGLMGAAQRGLSENEILQLLSPSSTPASDPLPRHYWAALYLALEDSLVSRDGQLGFFHDYLRQAVLREYLDEEHERVAANRRLAETVTHWKDADAFGSSLRAYGFEFGIRHLLAIGGLDAATQLLLNANYRQTAAIALGAAEPIQRQVEATRMEATRAGGIDVAASAQLTVQALKGRVDLKCHLRSHLDDCARLGKWEEVMKLAAAEENDEARFMLGLRAALAGRPVKSDDFKAFLYSLGLTVNERKLRGAPVEVEAKLVSSFRILGIRVDIDDITQGDVWDIGLELRDGAIRFSINGTLVAAKLVESSIGSACHNLPEDLRFLSATSLTELVDISPLARFRNLRKLDLSECSSLKDLSPLADLPEMITLKLDLCNNLQDIAPLGRLASLLNLTLRGCESLEDASPLASLSALRHLELIANFTLLKNAAAIGNLHALEVLILDINESLNDPTPIGNLHSLKILEISHFNNWENLDFVSRMRGLEQLIWTGCDSLNDMAGLRNLCELEFLLLNGCQRLVDLRPLAELGKLSKLVLFNAKKIADLRPLGHLRSLRQVSIEGSDTLHELAPLRNLNNLEELSVSKCRQLEAVDDLLGLPTLGVLKINDCPKVASVTLTGLPNLREVDLSGCQRISSLASLAAAPRITSLNLDGCTGIADFSPVAAIPSLKVLKVNGCKQLSALPDFDDSSHLEQIEFTGLSRVRSIEPLHKSRQLRIIESDFHPGMVAEILASAAVARPDDPFISSNASAWLGEVSRFADNSGSDRERLATTLGRAFGRLSDNHPIVPRYEAFLKSRPEFSAEPWKAWFRGTAIARHHAFDVLVSRIERLDLLSLTPGVVGGVCAALADDTAPAEHQNWARAWLEQFEKVHSGRAHALLQVSAEICLAYARLGESEALERWLTRFTDPSDPAALDPVQVALGNWRLGRGDFDAAYRHAAAVQMPRISDPLLMKLAEAWTVLESGRAGEILLAIVDPSLRCELMKILASNREFVAVPLNVQRLMVAAGDRPEALGNLIAEVGATADPAHFEELCALLQTSAEAMRSWRRDRLQQMLEAIDKE
ncbi:MAG: DUF4062 domain-containing protein [Verrucomicrobiota bacterium]